MIAADRPPKRLVFGFGHSAGDRSALRFAAELAASLQLRFTGLFSRDPALLRLAEHGLLREFRLMEGEWRSSQGSEVLKDLESTIASARKNLADAAGLAGVEPAFQIIPESLELAISAGVEEGDILALPEPAAGPGSSFGKTLKAVLATPAGALLLPRSAAPRRGPVVAIAKTPGDACAALASSIAKATHQELRLTAQPLDEVLMRPGEGAAILVLPRAQFDLRLLSLISMRRTPVLIAGGETGPAGEDRPPAAGRRALD